MAIQNVQTRDDIMQSALAYVFLTRGPAAGQSNVLGEGWASFHCQSARPPSRLWLSFIATKETRWTLRQRTLNSDCLARGTAEVPEEM